jgi:hypothetical protein
VCVSGRVAVCQDFGLTMAPAATSRIVVLTFCYNESTGTPVHYRIGKPLALLTNDFHTPKAVPSNESSPTNTGIAAMNVRALLESAKLEIKIGQRMDLGQADKHEYDDVQRRSGRNECHAPSESVEEQPDHRGEDDWDHALEGRVVPRRELRGAARGGLDVGEVRGVDGHCGVLEDFWEAWGIRAL